jgi:hypothetical protein
MKISLNKQKELTMPDFKVKDYVHVELNYKPASFGRQALSIAGTITSITKDTIILDHTHTIVLALTTVTILKNVSSLEFYKN